MNRHRRHAAARAALVRELELDGSLVLRPTGPSRVDLVRIDPSGCVSLYEVKTSTAHFRRGLGLTDGERRVAEWARSHSVPYVVARFHVSNAGGVETVRRVTERV